MNDKEFLDAEATMLTASGRWIDLTHPERNSYTIQDIAHHLSMSCRFSGAVSRFYSVAEHCVFVSRHCPKTYALEGLLHDASEAYLNDLIRPVKRLPGLCGYREIELRLEAAIAQKFGLMFPWPAPVKAIDDLALRVEKALLMGHGECPRGPSYPWGGWMMIGKPYQLPGGRRGWNPSKAKKMFLRRYREILGTWSPA